MDVLLLGTDPLIGLTQSLRQRAPDTPPRIGPRMRLEELVAGYPGARVVGDAAVEIAELVFDSRKAGPGSLFFCVRGVKVDGHEFAPRVVEEGAAALVVERELTELDVPQVVVPDSRAAMA